MKVPLGERDLHLLQIDILYKYFRIIKNPPKVGSITSFPVGGSERKLF